MYGGANETRYANDLYDFIEWAKGSDKKPGTIEDSNFYFSRLDKLKIRISAAYKGVFALLLKQGARDFFTGQKIESQVFFDEAIDIHHIFPKKWCEKHLEGTDYYYSYDHDYDSIVNKSPISSRTNRKIGGKAPSIYIKKIQDVISKPLDEILESHLINPKYLRNDDFYEFYETRKNLILKEIEKVTKNKFTWMMKYIDIKSENGLNHCDYWID